MSKKYYIIIILLISRISTAQNLVPNGDFEQFSTCPTSLGQLNLALNWINPSSTMTPAADYFNPCCTFFNMPNLDWGYQIAHSGNSFAGFGPYLNNLGNYREYMEVQLTSPLIANACYRLELYISLANNCNYTTDEIGIYFSETAITGINNNLPLPFTPQINNGANNFIIDTLNWILLTFEYIAEGDENYIVIGNFKNSSNTSILQLQTTGQNQVYFYIDDVSLFQVENCNTSSKDLYKGKWMSVYPNPFKNKLNITTSNEDSYTITFFDESLKQILSKRFENSISINTEQLMPGIYIYELKYLDQILKVGRVIKE